MKQSIVSLFLSFPKNLKSFSRWAEDIYLHLVQTGVYLPAGLPLGQGCVLTLTYNTGCCPCLGQPDTYSGPCGSSHPCLGQPDTYSGPRRSSHPCRTWYLRWPMQLISPLPNLILTVAQAAHLILVLANLILTVAHAVHLILVQPDTYGGPCSSSHSYPTWYLRWSMRLVSPISCSTWYLRWPMQLISLLSNLIFMVAIAAHLTLILSNLIVTVAHVARPTVVLSSLIITVGWEGEIWGMTKNHFIIWKPSRIFIIWLVKYGTRSIQPCPTLISW